VKMGAKAILALAMRDGQPAARVRAEDSAPAALRQVLDAQAAEF
jgi:histidyl-tRNA synthetase